MKLEEQYFLISTGYRNLESPNHSMTYVLTWIRAMKMVQGFW